MTVCKDQRCIPHFFVLLTVQQGSGLVCRNLKTQSHWAGCWPETNHRRQSDCEMNCAARALPHCAWSVHTPDPWDDDVSVFPTGCHKHVEGRLHKHGVLLNDARHVSAPHRHISLNSACAHVAKPSQLMLSHMRCACSWTTR